MTARDGNDKTTIQRGSFTVMGRYISKIQDGYISVIRAFLNWLYQILMFEFCTSENRHHPDAHILTSGRVRPIKCAHRKFSKIQTNRSKGGPKKKYSRFLRTHGVDRDIQLALKVFKFRFLGPPLFRFSWIFEIFWYTWLDWSNGAELRIWFLLLDLLTFLTSSLSTKVLFYL